MSTGRPPGDTRRAEMWLLRSPLGPGRACRFASRMSVRTCCCRTSLFEESVSTPNALGQVNAVCVRIHRTLKIGLSIDDKDEGLSDDVAPTMLEEASNMEKVGKVTHLQLPHALVHGSHHWWSSGKYWLEWTMFGRSGTRVMRLRTPSL